MRSSFALRAAATAAVVFLTGTVAWAADINVPADQPTIQQGIEAAAPGDRVLVAPGTYAELIDFRGKDIQVLGTGGATVTTIDGMRAGAVVTFQTGETRAAVLAGFTITHGAGRSSAGIRIEGASPTIQDNDVRHNIGGGILIVGGAPRINHNHIRSNTRYEGIGANDLTGDISIEDNLVEQNAGTGISVWFAPRALVARNVVRDNGQIGIEMQEIDSGAAFDNVVLRNAVGGLELDEDFDRSMAFINNTVADNGAVDLGIYGFDFSGSLLIANNIVRTSRAGAMVDCFLDGTGSLKFSDNLLHADNGAGITGGCDASSGLITDDPRFVGGTGPHAFWLSAGSPAIDSGDDKAARRIRWDATGGTRVIGGAVDRGAYEYRQE